MYRRRSVFALAMVVAALPACHHASKSKSPSDASKDPKAPDTAQHSVVPIGKATSGSMVALARVDGRRVAFVSDADTNSVLTVDLDTKTEGGALHLGSRTGELLLLPSGKLVVLSTGESKVVTIGALSEGGTDRVFIDVATEPRGVALSPDGSTMYVSSGWGRTLTAFDTKVFERKFEVPLAREPRSVVVSDDGSKVFISHAVGAHLSVVDAVATAPKLVDLRGEDTVALQTLKMFEQSRIIREQQLDEAIAATTSPKDKAVLIREKKQELASMAKKTKEELQAEKRVKEGLPTCQSFALAKSTSLGGRLYIPEVVVDPGETEVKSDGYGSGNGMDSETPAVAVLDPKTASPLPISMRRTTERSSRGTGDGQCLLPRAAAVDEKNHELLVTCLGIDSLVAYDATSAAPATSELRRWKVGAGPMGVAIDPDARQAVVWSQFDRTLSIIPLDQPKGKNEPPAAIARIAMGHDDEAPDAVPTSLALGRVLFHRSNDGRISGDGRSCASCHPDGRDDGLVWSTPEGPRRSIMLAGRLDTAPFSWQGNTSTVQKHLNGTFQRLGGGGLEGAELDALVNYVKSLRPKGTLSRGGARDEDEKKIAAGARIFDSPRTGCSSCHSGTSFTDGAMHNVGSGRAFNTPSLLNVGSGGPWFHDGRYTSLQDLLKKSDGKMGHTKHLKPEELDALETFLKVL